MTTDKPDGLINNLKQKVHKLIDPEWDEQKVHLDEGHDSDSEPVSVFHINEAVSNRVKKIINDFIEAAPLIEAAGFRIKDLEVELSVIPKLIPHFEKCSHTDDATRLDILQQVKDKTIIGLLLKTLFKADNFQQSLKMGRLEFAGIEIEITAIPAVRLLYKNPGRINVTVTDLVE